MYLGEGSDVLGQWRAMVRACRGMLDSHDDAEDCASQALMQALAHSSLAADNPTALLVTMAKRRAADEVRSRARMRTRALRMASQADDVVLDVADDIVERAEANWLRDQMRFLPDDTQSVVLTLAEGATPAQTARILGMTKRAVESHLLRARRVLKESWVKTLGLAGCLWWSVKRWLPMAPLTAAVATLLFSMPYIAASPAPLGQPMTAQLERPALSADSAAPLVAGTARPRRQGPPARTVATQTPDQSARRAVASVGSPAGTIVRVTEQDRGGSDSTPVEAVLACVAHFEVQPGRVGC